VGFSATRGSRYSYPCRGLGVFTFDGVHWGGFIQTCLLLSDGGVAYDNAYLPVSVSSDL
jgi:hypothetical protein